ncbi:hypothetical protein [Roseicella aquatilis]|uniref:Uncharacterized protein n=1 Tax=Roseicella aquatilis TaxID=2527868 RepID=A0A4R4DQM6_9PROT|nr:hypothetical protein [Roseicella aquatilis]TCZ64419.1 hypothetical protein EXY23_07160 [Roseicella aquatilis]
MGWIVLGLLVLLGMPFVMAFMGIALALWFTLFVLGLVWGMVTFVFQAPIIAILLVLGAGYLLGRHAAPRRG